MASRRLVSRQSRAEPEETPLRRSRPSDVSTPRQIAVAALPPYEAPNFPLTDKQQLELGSLTRNHDYTKYKKHITTAMSTLANCAAESNERLFDAKTQLEKHVRQKRKAEENDAMDLSQRSQVAEDTEKKVEELERKVDNITTAAEKALRDLIDYRDEMTQWETMMNDVGEKARENAIEAGAAEAMRDTAGRPRTSQRDAGSNSEDEDAAMEDSEQPTAVEVLSPSELLREARAKYHTSYTTKPMHARYVKFTHPTTHL